MSKKSEICFFVECDRLQIKYSTEDYERYKDWTGESRIKKLAYLNALFKIKTENHVQAVVSGEFSQGKSSTAITIARWDQIYTRRLLKIHRPEEYLRVGKENLRFSVENNIIISPKDPAYKFIAHPKEWNSYVIDEGYLVATTSEATTNKTKKIRDNIAQNRKVHPSMYWVYPNIFKMPSNLLELMDELIHKEKVNLADVIIPARVIQLKEKFDKIRIERYAKRPKLFAGSIRHHPSFVAKIHTPKIKGRLWDLYLAKYKKYKVTDDEPEVKDSVQNTLFKKIESLISRNVITIRSQEDLKNMIYTLVSKSQKNPSIAQSLSDVFTNRYIEWQEEKMAKELSESLSKSILDSEKGVGNFFESEEDEDNK